MTQVRPAILCSCDVPGRLLCTDAVCFTLDPSDLPALLRFEASCCIIFSAEIDWSEVRALCLSFVLFMLEEQPDHSKKKKNDDLKAESIKTKYNCLAQKAAGSTPIHSPNKAK
mgnify:CR=1 FL=1